MYRSDRMVTHLHFAFETFSVFPELSTVNVQASVRAVQL